MTEDPQAYERRARAELVAWRARMLRRPSAIGNAARGVQARINAVIPEKVHEVVTTAIAQMTRGILAGADWTTAAPLRNAGLSEREARVRERISLYRTTAAAEGGIAGAGGFLLAAADFPALIAIKITLLFEIAALYGHDGEDIGERLYILLIFQLAFSSPAHRREVLEELDRWPGETPRDLATLDWRKFQQEYRDHIDLAKLAQLLPLVGAPIGAVVNFQLTDKLGEAAMNAYRMRWFAGGS
jgi:hypothetical protein